MIICGIERGAGIRIYVSLNSATQDFSSIQIWPSLSIFPCSIKEPQHILTRQDVAGQLLPQGHANSVGRHRAMGGRWTVDWRKSYFVGTANSKSLRSAVIQNLVGNPLVVCVDYFNAELLKLNGA